MAFSPWKHLHQNPLQERQLGTYRRLCTVLGAPMFQFGFFLWGIWMIFVWITAHDQSHPLIIAMLGTIALCCLLLALYGLKRGMLGNLLLRNGTFAEGLVVSKERTSIFVTGPKAVSGRQSSQQYLWKMKIQFEIPGQSEPSCFTTLTAADGRAGPNVSEANRTLVMYNPTSPAQAMRFEDIPLENQFESFEQLVPNAPPAKILVWPAIIAAGHSWALIWLLMG